MRSASARSIMEKATDCAWSTDYFKNGSINAPVREGKPAARKILTEDREMAKENFFTDPLLDKKRLLGDREADEFIHMVFSDPAKKELLQRWLRGDGEANSLEGLNSLFPGFTFIEGAAQLPAWADPELMKYGSAFFARHSKMIMSLLGLLSLPYCYTAANGAMVLYISERIRTHTTKRLFDTAIFVWEVMGPDAFSDDGKAFTAILKVRIMHAAVRYYTLQSGKWDKAWGLPVNQEDMAGTNLSFSLIVVRGLRQLGFSVSRKDEFAFLHLWAIIGYLSGLDKDLIPENQEGAENLDSIIKKRQFRVSSHGQELTESLINHIMSVNTSRASVNDIKGLMRYLLGKDIADMLVINAPELGGYKLGLIRTLNKLKNIVPKPNSEILYHRAYTAFKLLNPELSKRV